MNELRTPERALYNVRRTMLLDARRMRERAREVRNEDYARELLIRADELRTFASCLEDPIFRDFPDVGQTSIVYSIGRRRRNDL